MPRKTSRGTIPPAPRVPDVSAEPESPRPSRSAPKARAFSAPPAPARRAQPAPEAAPPAAPPRDRSANPRMPALPHKRSSMARRGGA
jgi:hypothetical protein